MMFLKKFILLFIPLFLVIQVVYSQDSVIIKWQANAKKIDDKNYEIHIFGKIKENWHLYTKGNAEAELEGVKIKISDQNITLDSAIQIIGTSKTITDKIFNNKKIEVVENNVELLQKIKINGSVPSKIKLTLTHFTGSEDNFLPNEDKLEVSLNNDSSDLPNTSRILIPNIHLDMPVNDCGGVGETSGSIFKIFLLGILGGIVSLFTPCVFPMIPLTVSFFTKKSGDRKKAITNAFLYGFFILIIYVLISIPFHFLGTGNASILNGISTNAWLNLFFFIIFLVFAFSFFGCYEISLPDKFSNTADAKAGLGNIMGIFFMALTLTIVSFSCTGPLLGTLLVGVSNGGANQLTAAMAGFGFAFGLPFALFAMFPNLLTKLPKSGGWLNSVKVVLGFVEIGLALKFLSNADLVKHWGLLKREVFIGIWIVLGILIVLYLLGKIKFPHDSEVKKMSKIRIAFIILFSAFTIYLLPGVTNTKWAQLASISGFPPPYNYSIYKKQDLLTHTKDYETGLKMAREQHKAILLDFTGFACVNCRRMEEKVWTNPDVQRLMQENFIVISLYVDDKKLLPAEQQFTYKNHEGVANEIVTVGDKWSIFESENFKNNAQPLYAILNTNEELMNKPVAYNEDATLYKNWLECGLAAAKK